MIAVNVRRTLQRPPSAPNCLTLRRILLLWRPDTGRPAHRHQHRHHRLATRAIVGAALPDAAACLGTLGGVLFAYGDDLPEITALDDYRPNTITRILARNGSVVGEFATERRVVIGYDDMAPVLRQAIIATEDADFEQHFGLSISRIVMTAVKDVITGQRAGASTITQQLARNLFLQATYMRGGVYARSGREGLERKIKEALLAHPDRAALHQARDLHVLRQPGAAGTARTAWKPAPGCTSTSRRRT